MNMTKATVNYRQEKTHMMSAVDRSFTDQSTLQEDERLGLSFMDAPGYSPRGKYQPSQTPGSQVTGQILSRPSYLLCINIGPEIQRIGRMCWHCAWRGLGHQ